MFCFKENFWNWVWIHNNIALTSRRKRVEWSATTNLSNNSQLKIPYIADENTISQVTNSYKWEINQNPLMGGSIHAFQYNLDS